MNEWKNYGDKQIYEWLKNVKKGNKTDLITVGI